MRSGSNSKMKFTLNSYLSDKALERLQLAILVIFSIIPLFIQLPFKINLFLAWEGAYRLSIGQIPFKDFSLPMGFGFWLIPALFFKIFGPYLFTLVKAQVFINLVSGLVFRSILKKLSVEPAKRLLALLFFCISYIFIHFWPWYNHSVFVFELIAIDLVISYMLTASFKRKVIYLSLCTFFIVLSFFTKQDGGALAITTVSTLMLYLVILEKDWRGFLVYSGTALLWIAAFVLPFLPYDFGYWFNVGQEPHNSRVKISDILTDAFEGSLWIKFYLLIIAFILFEKIQNWKEFFHNKTEFIFALLILCILGQAMLVQVTSYIPHTVNIYFHSFVIAYILHSVHLNFKIQRTWVLGVLICLILFWWSADYWRYGKRIISRIAPSLVGGKVTLNEVSKYSWAVPDSTKIEKPLVWKASDFRTFRGVLLPEETIEGMETILNLEIVKSKKDLKVLNMSELTPLAYEIGFTPIINQPLWFHRNVSVFDRDIEILCKNIEAHQYDLVLFEEIPELNQFYPEAVRISLQKYYSKVASFQAPRDLSKSFIEVYTKEVN